MMVVQRLGWTLLHFLWQGTAIVALYAMLRRVLAGSLSAPGRYTLACAALIAMAVAPPATFLLIPNSGEVFWTISVTQWQWFSASVVGVWLFGVLVFSIRLLGAWRFTARLRSSSYPAPAEWQQIAQRIAHMIGARVRASRPVQLLVSSLVDVPTVIGWLRPAILIPVEALTGIPTEHLEALLAHEMAHIRRHDYLASILQSVAEALLFYHPGVWWISEQIRVERELCCDDLAVAASGDVLVYARALTALESRQTSRVRRPALAANGGSLVNRIRRLIEGENSLRNSAPAPGAIWAMALLWFAGIGLASVHAAQTPVPAPRVLNPEPIPFFSRGRRALLYDPFIPGPPVQRAQLQASQAQTAQNSNGLGSPWSEWLNEDVLYLITEQERTAFLQLSSDEERTKFVEQFWLVRDPTPDTAENEFKTEHYRRMAYANQHFSSSVPGWKTDRGHVYITYGPPDEINVSSVPYPAETWRYRFIEGMGTNVSIEFTDAGNSGEYRLSPAIADQLRSLAMASWRGPMPAPAIDPQVKTNAAMDSALGTKVAGNVLPMRVRVDYVRVTDTSTMANVAVQFENRDLGLQLNDGIERAQVNLFGRITTMTRRPVTTFEKPLSMSVPQEQMQKFSQLRSVYQQSVPLAPGHYRLNLVAKDTVSGNLNNYEVVLDVPGFSGDQLAAGSLVIADSIERLPARTLGGGAFAIGDSKVRPRLGNTFLPDEKMGIYLQIYNFKPDATTQKPVGSVEYEIDKAGSNEKVLSFSEEAGTMPNASASQVTIEKMLPLKTFASGIYVLRVKVTDRNGNQSLQRQESFTLGPE